MTVRGLAKQTLDQFGQLIEALLESEQSRVRLARCYRAMRAEREGRMTVKQLHDICNAVTLRDVEEAA